MTPTELQQFLRDKLRKAYSLGQTWWQQADSEYRRENKKADETAAKFAELVENVVLAVTFELNRAGATEAAKSFIHADELIGLSVSMDVSTGDDDADHRIFGKVIATMPSEDGITILAEEESRNFSEAAKATGTAGELPPKQNLTLDNAPIGTMAPSINGGAWYRTERGWKWNNGSTFPRPGGDWNGELIAPTEAARQPAPVVAVKTWQERMFDNAEAGNQIGSSQRFMRQEIADLRAALAAISRSQP